MRQLEENSASKPAWLDVDLRAEKPFKIGPASMSAFLRVFNLFDARYANGFVFATTGSPFYSLTPRGRCGRPGRPRAVRLAAAGRGRPGNETVKGIPMSQACPAPLCPDAPRRRRRGADPSSPWSRRTSAGSNDAERSGTHDAGNIRTIFWNYGMVGDYPADPINVDLSVFHSVEVPKGSGMNYTDGITPFVLAKRQRCERRPPAYIMETGYRETAGAPARITSKIMRFEPRPGYFQADPAINRGTLHRHEQRPAHLAGKLAGQGGRSRTTRAGPGSWNGYFGKRPNADQESYFVMDDDYYDRWDHFFPDYRDSTRRGLGLRVEVRGFQWANPQATNVIFWHYDITNEGTTDYIDNIIFGLYMDSGVGGSAHLLRRRRRVGRRQRVLRPLSRA